MSESKIREEFEAWHREQVIMLMVAGELSAARSARQLEPVYWCAWQASRESLVIELPEIWDFGPSEGYEHATLIECLKSQGLKVSK
ncbi:hypothetical protein QN382_19860 [Pseudomonas sp. 10B1]|uniref:hypothetical protein n=1 Tax=Pseudomonas sp. 10B1 TaxID=3048573 RepID=UPI002B236D53|nr:hypothetical protein [Pseudomonas sp. 10B1]MEB0311533.1 hypothetical protein [Pseudomonas sp. 10B1]